MSGRSLPTGYLVTTQDGSVVTSLALDSVLAANGGTAESLSLASLPGGASSKAFTPGLYTVFLLI